MKLTKKLEAEILKTYYDVWDAYLKGDMRTFASILDENCYIIGSAAGEVFKNKKAAVKYYKSTSEQITGKAEFRNRKIKVMPVEKGFMVNEESDLYLLIDDQWTFYGPGRISSLFHKKNNKWKVIHQHGSFPDSKTEEGEQVNTDKIKAENIQLRDAVKRRTEELEGKNRELEIEAALERVRSRTNAMHRSENLHDIINEVNDQLRQLGFRFDGTDFLTDYSDKGYNLWLANFPTPIYVPAIDHKIFHLLKNFFKRGDNFFTFTLSTEEKNIHFKNVFENTIAKNFPEELRQHVYNAKGMATSCVVLENIILSVTNFASIPYSDTENEILKRFAKVFQQSYTRFLDLQKAEAQAREARIEAALEKVRGRAMAMHKSEELLEAGALLYRELSKLGIEKLTSGYMLIDEDEKMGWNYGVNPTNGQIIPKPVGVPLTEKKEIRSIIEAWKRQEPIHVKHLDPEETIIHQSYMADHAVNFPISKEKLLSITPERLVIHTFNFKHGYLIIVRGEVLSAEQQEMVVRFAKVFEMTYRRFLDLQKAEAQVREAQIETALEKVRSKTMAMHKSEEVTGIAVSLNEELLKLGFEGGSTIIIIDKERGDTEQWTGFSEDKTLQSCYVPYFKHPSHDALLDTWKRGEKFLVYTLTGKEKKAFDEHYFATGYKHFPESDKKWMRQMRSVTFSYAFMKFGAIHWGPGHLTEEQLRILQRFAKVFEQSYTRFLDLQKAEAQVREAQIEAALERVRSRSMAMHKSDDLHEVIKVVTEQLSVLDLKFNVANFAKINQDGSWDLWLSTPEQAYPALIHVPYLDHPIFNRITEEEAKGNDFYTDVYTWEETNIFFHHFFENTIARNTPEERKQFVYSSKGLARSVFQTKNIWFSVARYDIAVFTDEENGIFKRFANVFEQAYTRFLDLQKAEAQAREAQIEASLERVRSRAMAMQNSDELRELIGTVFTELTKLDIVLTRCLIMIYDPRSNDSVWWMANSEAPTEPIGLRIQNHEHPPYAAYLKAWQEKKLNWVYVLEGAVKVDWDNFLFVETELSHLPDFVIAGMKAPERVYLNSSFNSFGNLTLATLEPLSNEHFDILLRFAKVFDLTYTRFNDLKQAEAQAREARIETALERVRSRTMAMQKPDELADAAQILYREFATLNIKTFSCGYMFIDEEKHSQTAWVVLPDGTLLPSFIVFPLTGDHVLDNRYKDWKEKKPLHLYEIQGEVNKEHHKFLSNHVPPFVVKDIFSQVPDRIVFHCANFSSGYLLILATDYFSQEDQQTVIRFAKVFEMTYTRFLDLKQAEAQAREAQIELALERVRARTMAMHKSEELAETAQVLFQQLSELGGIPDRIAIGLADEEEGVVNYWTTDQSGRHIDKRFKARLNERTVLSKTYKAWKDQKKSLVVDLHGEDVIEWVKFAREEMGVIVKDEFIKDRRVHSFAFFSHGWILVTTHEPQSTETIQILERFASVFNLTYRRFLDLEKAEAQAREAQIEAALEKVRSRSLAMHKSDELQEVVKTVFERLTELNIEMDSANLAIFHEGKRDFDFWIASHFQNKAISFHIAEEWGFPIIQELINARENKQDFFSRCFSFEEKNNWFNYAFENTDFKNITIERRKYILESKAYALSIAFSKNTGIQINNYSGRLPSEGEIEILKRFSKVFEQAYIRFLDLQKAEAQARESQIEGALEKIRSHTMGMRSSEDLANVASVMFDQMRILGGDLFSFGIVLCDKDENMVEQWHGIPGAGMMAPFFVPVNLDHIHQYRYDQWKTGTELFSIVIPEDYIAHHFELMLALPSVKAVWEGIAAQGIALPPIPTWEIDYGASFRYGYLLVSALKPFEEDKIFPRFAKVFEQAYTRFLDLQKAEAQAKEAQIEASLERVRSKTMAMHNSQDVGNTVATMFDQLVHLGVKTNRCGILIFSDTNNTEVWTAKSGSTGEAALIIGHLDITIHPMLQGVHHAWKNNESFYNYELAGDDIKNYYNAINNYPDYPTRFNLDNLPSREIHSDFFFPEGAVFSFTSEPVPEEDALIFKRFAGVFGQTYRRYLDLQKAEANAREAQIEAGLERVRARTMAMHSSEDVSIATATMFTELEKLGIENFRGGITNIIPNRTQHVWSVNNLEEGRVLKSVGTFNIDAHPFWQLMYKEWEAKKDFIHYYLAGEDKQDYFEVVNAIQGYLPQNFQQYPDLHFQVYYFNEGAVWTNSLQPHSEEDKQVMKRFTSVFSLTYRRYQDLKKAEAQAKEATIEAALERVRGKAMAMHNSNDLSVTTSMIITELGKLGIKPIRCGVGIINKETHKGQLYTARFSPDGDSLSVVGWVLLEGHPVLENIYEKWVEGEDYFPELSGDSRKAYYEQLLAGLSVPTPDFKDEQIHYGHFFSFSVGCLYAWSEVKYNDDEIKILKRFASIIDLTFRRYFELQKSETNAREAVKQAALDRVRAEIASMRTINDLDRITPLIWNELTVLGIPFIRCGVFIMDEDQQLIHTFLSTPDGKAIAAFHLPYDTPGNLRNVVSNWKQNKNYIDHWDEAEFIQFADILVKGGALVSAEQYLKTIPKGGFYLHFLPFLQGMLYVGNTNQLKEEEIELIQHVADAFSTAYARYEDFNKLESAKQQVEKTLTDLKQAQTQLVQSEKMASLGELTAGIAHEIQNPLNFVNNFSEVSKELLDEMKTELETGNTEDAKDIADDVIQNLEKINHHGKRADAIVKSMLQHSRSSTGKKEPTDINGLADEYLRLAYHGLRAKDKSFNSKFETEFDSSIGKINIISQDIGRVLVNLINNAFYAVSERKKQESNGYEPSVTVYTKKVDDKIEIKVKDNGNGIPQKVLDKIFQPFFTTKPTGQGTGLGLSLAYDIITKGHGGELKVETKEGEGSEFVILLAI